MTTDKLSKAITLVEKSFMTLDDAAKSVGISQVYFRRIVEGLETKDAPLKRYIFNKQVILATDVTVIREKIETARASRAEKAQAKLEEQVAKKSEPKGPTLLDLKLEARELQVPVGRKNKAELIAALEAKRTEMLDAELAEMTKHAEAQDAEIDAQDADQQSEDPALALETVLAE